ncbi:neutral/alkaline non-lysosomal ceramidase N-terminal domain-containing protein [Paenibacillus spongiae]|uniref:Neutral/alkaline non-lysosomal ceramidase N-terminal domain-containing protein n=1 Tax=Paenibacillus spongiae TaxID=2909671 RepID=A0ABY5SGE6_9BACL|nr:neutral/alkaline non-lysosomal ceramidase N-terminal domain-containing protein [Paenibacillus spongiae]UVI33066.1 neutral/alkaline non-lysosomal ceramidase N-terminal domain-containing protein [Paenibacillus spongiae]
MLKAGAARAVINPPLTMAQGGWGAQTHITPTHIESDFWCTALVLGDGQTAAVVLDLDLCLLSNLQADQIRTAIAAALRIDKLQVRVSTTHTHAGPVVGDASHAPNRDLVELYVRYLIEQSVSAAVEAANRQVTVSVHAEYGACSIGKNRRQTLDSGRIITGFNESGETDPTVSIVRFDDEEGKLVASIVHYAAHPTTLGYTNQAASPDYPGVTKRFVEQTVGGICLFLQGATGDIGPGPGGFLDRMDVVQDMGTMLGCAASQALLEARNKQFRYSFSEVVESGASLGIWSRTRKPQDPVAFQVLSHKLSLPVGDLKPTNELEKINTELVDKLTALRDGNAPAEQISEANFQLKRNNMALRYSRNFYGKPFAEIEAHFIRVGDTVLIGVPLEPFTATGKRIRAHSPFPYTLFSGYSNGANGYLATAEAFAEGGYEVLQTAFAPEAADLLADQILQVLDSL